LRSQLPIFGTAVLVCPFLGRNNRRFVEIRKIFVKKISISALSCYYFVLIAEN